MSTLVKTDLNLPMWAKGVIAVAGTGVILFGLYQGYQAWDKHNRSKDANAVSDSAKDTYKDLLKKGQKLTYPESAYGTAANTIQKLLNGGETITTEIQVVNEIIKVVKKPVDWYYLISVFASRDIDDLGYGKSNYDLPTLLKDQLDSTLIGDKVNGKFYWSEDTLYPLTEYLANMGITI